MTRLNSRIAALVGFTLLIACFMQVDAGGDKTSAAKVKATATASKVGADGRQTVTIALTIEKPFYIYRNPVGAEDYESARTKVAFKAKEKLTASINFPAGKQKIEVSKEGTLKYDIYEERVVLTAQLQRTPGDGSPLEVTIDVNACHPGDPGKKNGYCLAPGKIRMIVK